MSGSGRVEGRGDGLILTLEPLIDVVRDTVERHGWRLSGLQKTTSYEYAGRWEGDSTRSAYLFFHSEVEALSLDVFLDETSRGLTGNLALVVAGPTLGELGDAEGSLARLADVARECMPEGLEVPLSVRARLRHPRLATSEATTEFRIKVLLGKASIRAGERVVAAIVRSALAAFSRLAAHRVLEDLLDEG